ncbi:hypothetical protein [Catelliglobosispora koreensis]|uniref:hypothetical protein n=1 Tax=Catelliglobosispora koreensis TaxID=129052 RepID=UPI000477427F|nr:hypothetical protein [Catelliglobosispora koreensis]
MVRTTPPRPVDIAAIFPELSAHRATATRLHPRAGRPTVHDSSVGGPLMWPAEEPWPYCEREHEASVLVKPDDVRRWRQILLMPKGERPELPDLDESEPEELAHGPIAMLPVMQLYRKDIPDFIGPADADVLQVLWCPLDHPDEHYSPHVFLKWRNTSGVTEVLVDPPQPVVVSDSYLPEPCVLHPEQVAEYQYRLLLPPDLSASIKDWEATSDLSYQSDLSISPGYKVAGFASWHLTDPYPMDCDECGSAMSLLVTIASYDGNGTEDSWAPVEDQGSRAGNDTEILIGRGYALWVFFCPQSFEHPCKASMQ